MQLDRTRIAIRERSGLDILDLSLHVLRSHARPVAWYTLAGALPLTIFNYALLYNVDDLPTLLVWTTLLMLVELPFANAPLTLYLGRALFDDEPTPGEIARDFRQSLSQLVLFQLILRAVLIVPLFLPYALWPFLSEIVLLERNPLSSHKKGEMTTMRRNTALHEAEGGVIVWGLIACMMLLVAAMLVASFWLSWWQVVSLLTMNDEFNRPLVAVGLPLSIWVVSAYFTVVRFLSYLDVRIRREGWEVELLLRAQRARLMRRLT